MPQAGRKEHVAELESLCGGVDTQYVHLPEWLAALVMDLRPVVADHLVVSHREQETCGVEPRGSDPVIQISVGPPALLGMLGKGVSVDGKPRLVILPWHERADLHAFRGR